MIDSVLLPQLHVGSTESWKLWLNLCSFKMLRSTYYLEASQILLITERGLFRVAVFSHWTQYF